MKLKPGALLEKDDGQREKNIIWENKNEECKQVKYSKQNKREGEQANKPKMRLNTEVEGEDIENELTKVFG